MGATAEQAQETHAEIRKWIAENVSPECAAGIRIQYGGSANAKNAPELSACREVLSSPGAVPWRRLAATLRTFAYPWLCRGVGAGTVCTVRTATPAGHAHLFLVPRGASNQPGGAGAGG